MCSRMWVCGSARKYVRVSVCAVDVDMKARPREVFSGDYVSDNFVASWMDPTMDRVAGENRR